MDNALAKIREFLESEMREIDREFLSASRGGDDERIQRIIAEQTRLVDVSDALNALKSALYRYRNVSE